MGSVRGGPRRPNTAAYFVALAGILILLAALCCYFFYFCLSKVKELTREDSPLNQPCTNTSAAARAQQRATYPVQRGVRDSATAMARLCRQLPAAPAPAPASPARPAVPSPDAGDTSAADSADPVTDTTNDDSVSAIQEKLPEKPAMCAAGVVAAS